MSAERVIASLLRIAREDLDGARRLNTRGNRNAIYRCEQAAEKLIRAVLTSEKSHAGVRHQLDEMVGLVPEQNPVKPQLRDLQHLSVYATAYRYTTPTGRIPDDPPPEIAARTELDAERERTPHGFLEVNRHADTRVAVDGVDVEVAAGIPLQLAPGSHRVALTRPDGHVSTAVFEIEAGRTAQLHD